MLQPQFSQRYELLQVQQQKARLRYRHKRLQEAYTQVKAENLQLKKQLERLQKSLEVERLHRLQLQLRMQEITKTPEPVDEMSRIIYEVAKRTGITEAEMCSRSRKREIITARKIAMALMEYLTRQSQTVIAHRLGCEHHTTVIHARESLMDLVETDSEIRDTWMDLMDTLTKDKNELKAA